MKKIISTDKQLNKKNHMYLKIGGNQIKVNMGSIQRAGALKYIIGGDVYRTELKDFLEMDNAIRQETII